jgi:hypothetical protein
MTTGLPGPTPRGRRMNRSRAIAAGTSVGALVVLTAGVAVANPGSHTAAPASSSGTTSSDTNRVQPPSTDDGADSGWTTPDDGGLDPNSGWATPQAPSGSGSFDPGLGGGSSTRSGGS